MNGPYEIRGQWGDFWVVDRDERVIFDVRPFCEEEAAEIVAELNKKLGQNTKTTPTEEQGPPRP